MRNGLERLIWAWDTADRASEGQLLSRMSEAAIYEMGLSVMMRLVFMLYAEERHLLPHGQGQRAGEVRQREVTHGRRSAIGKQRKGFEAGCRGAQEGTKAGVGGRICQHRQGNRIFDCR